MGLCTTFADFVGEIILCGANKTKYTVLQFG